MKKKYFFLFFLMLSFTTLFFSENFKEHIMQKGETLWRISKNYGVSLEELCKINNIDDITKVKTGTIIMIPLIISDDNQKNTSTPEYQEYSIKKGETLWSVGKKFKINIDELIKINNIHDITKVQTGLTIKIPINKEENKSIENDYKDFKVHYLKKGETIWRISKKYRVPVQKICEINNINDITKISLGSKIIIPVKVEYLNYELPLDGEISIFKTSNFNGVHIFTEEDLNKRNVCSIDKGKVSYIDSIPGYGLTVFIRHENGLLSTYSGMETINIKEDDEVNQDQIIGIAGNLSRYEKYGILFSIQHKGNGLEFDKDKKKFIKTVI